jgi:hypothetical protein
MFTLGSLKSFSWVFASSRSTVYFAETARSEFSPHLRREFMRANILSLWPCCILIGFMMQAGDIEFRIVSSRTRIVCMKDARLLGGHSAPRLPPSSPPRFPREHSTFSLLSSSESLRRVPHIPVLKRRSPPQCSHLVTDFSMTSLNHP